MAKERDDIFEFKIGTHGINIDIRALWRRFFSKTKPESAVIVAERFLQVFRDHGVSDMQIPRLIPTISIEQLRNSEALLPVLTNDVIERCAKLFKIRRTWLEGEGGQMYDYHWSYADPQRFFEDLAVMQLNSTLFPIIALCTEPRLDYRSRHKQPIVLCLVEKIVDLGDDEIRRYTIFNDDWDWGYRKSRIRLKAMIRAINQVMNIPAVPIYLIKRGDLEKIESGYCVPRPYLKGKRLHNIALEDYVRYPEESAVSKEADELPEVVKYMQDCGLMGK